MDAEAFLQRRGFKPNASAEAPKEAADVVEVLPCNWLIVDWFMDLTSDFKVVKNKTSAKLEGPSKQDMIGSAELLNLDWSRYQYDGLKIMIIAAQEKFRECLT